MSKANRDRWVEKQIHLERRKSPLILMIIAFFLAVLTVLLAYLILKPHMDGLYRLDTADRVSRFCAEDYVNAVLVYDSASDTHGSFTLTSSNDRTLSAMMNGAYMEVPINAKPSEKEYHVWKLTGDGYTVLYCTEGTFEDTGSVHVQSQYRELSVQIIGQFSPGAQNVYVLYDAGSLIPAYAVMAASAFAAIFLALLSRSPFMQKRSHLGKQIVRLGDYETIKADINRQSLHPLFENSGCTILQDWIFFRTSYGSFSNAPQLTTIVPVSSVREIKIAPDEEGDANIFVCSFYLDGYTEAFEAYLDSQEVIEMEKLKSLLCSGVYSESMLHADRPSIE